MDCAKLLRILAVDFIQLSMKNVSLVLLKLFAISDVSFFVWISKSGYTCIFNKPYKQFYSLPNISNQIRWALDLRWQRPDQPFGLYGLKDGLLLRKDGKNVEPDWEKFEAVDRTTVQKKSVEGFVDVSCLIPRIRFTCTSMWTL